MPPHFEARMIRSDYAAIYQDGLLAHTLMKWPHKRYGKSDDIFVIEFFYIDGRYIIATNILSVNLVLLDAETCEVLAMSSFSDDICVRSYEVEKENIFLRGDSWDWGGDFGLHYNVRDLLNAPIEEYYPGFINYETCEDTAL